MSNRTTSNPDIPVWAAQADRPYPVVLVSDGSGAGAVEVSVAENAVISTLNSTTTPLTAAATFPGGTEDVENIATILVSIASDADSAEDGVVFYASDDGSLWYETDSYTYKDGGGIKIWAVQAVRKYFKVSYTNGAVDQTSFTVTTKLFKTVGVVAAHRIDSPVSGYDDAGLMKGTIMAQRTGDQNNQFDNVKATPQGELLVSVVSPIGTLPVSQLTTLHDGKIINRDYTEILETVTGGTGSGTFLNNTYPMSVAATADYVIKRGIRRAAYFSGKPQKIELTFSDFAPQAGVIKRVGYFSSNTASPYDSSKDGFWLESNGDENTIKIVAQNNGVTTIEKEIGEWTNYANLGSYQTFATWDQFTVIEFNFLWLGGAYIEMRMMTQYGWVTAHYQIPAGVLDGPFIKSPSHPVRYEIRATDNSGGSFTYICNQIATSGSISESGLSRGIHTPVAGGSTFITLATIGTVYPVIGIRQQAGRMDNAALLRHIGLFIASADQGIWTLHVNPSITGGGWAGSWSPIASSSLEEAHGDGTSVVSAPGIVIAADDITQGQTVPGDILERNFLAWLGGSITGATYPLVLCFEPATTNCNVRGSMTALES